MCVRPPARLQPEPLSWKPTTAAGGKKRERTKAATGGRVGLKRRRGDLASPMPARLPRDGRWITEMRSQTNTKLFGRTPPPPPRDTVISEGEPGVCQALKGSVCVRGGVCMWGWHRDNNHVTEHDPEVQPSESQYGVKYRRCIRAEGLQLPPIKQVSVHLISLINGASFTRLCFKKETKCRVCERKLSFQVTRGHILARFTSKFPVDYLNPPNYCLLLLSQPAVCANIWAFYTWNAEQTKKNDSMSLQHQDRILSSLKHQILHQQMIVFTLKPRPSSDTNISN